MQRRTAKQQRSEADFDRTREEAFSNEGGGTRAVDDTAPTGVRALSAARAQDHPRAVRAGVRFPARRSGYPNNQIKFD